MQKQRAKMNLIMMLLREKSKADKKNGMQMTLKKCENHFQCYAHIVLQNFSLSLSLFRSQLETKTKIKTNILYANFCIHCRFVFYSHSCLRSFVSFHKPTHLFPSITKSFANSSLSLSLFRSHFSRNFYDCFLLWFCVSRIGFANERRIKVFVYF